jgi:EmrB/QacA subfamily drug resistance transporter
MIDRERLIPIIVAMPLFLQNLDTSVMATALPAIARSLDVEVLHLNLAITSYLLSLAVFMPASGWLADRFGPKRLFIGSILFFSVGSALCGAANSLPQLVIFRVIQGMGGAMMVPVARLLLLRSIPPARLMSAMIWFTVPAVIGRMAGPLFGGVIVTVASWRWIFLVNVPFGVMAVLASMRFVEEHHEPSDRQFDFPGFVLLAAALVGLVGALETVGRHLLPQSATITMLVVGLCATALYQLHTRKHADPMIDTGTLRFPIYRTAVIGGMPLRIAIGASPFLLPLLLQLGFGLSPLTSGTLTVATAIGSLCTRTVMKRAIALFGFRRLLLIATTTTSLFYMSYGLFRPITPHLLIFLVLMGGGLCNSLAMVALNAFGYTEIPKPKMSHATTLATMAQQLSLSLGVAFGAALLSLTSWVHGENVNTLHARDFSPAFIAIGCMTLMSLWFFRRLDASAGAELKGG